MSIKIEAVRTSNFCMEYFRFDRGGKTLVILPGLSVRSVMDAADAVAQAYAALTDEFTVFVFDRRAQLPPVYPIRDMARDTAQAMQSLGLKDVCLFGASQGGMIALALAMEYPELVGKLALGSTTGHVTDAEYAMLDRWVRLAREKDRKGLCLAFGQAIYPPAVFEQVRERLLETAETVTDEELERFIVLTEGTRGFNVTDGLDRIRCPVFAVGAFEDQVLDSDATMEIAEKLDHRKDFRLYMYTGFGHAAFDTAPDYRTRLLRFFRGEEAGDMGRPAT